MWFVQDVWPINNSFALIGLPSAVDCCMILNKGMTSSRTAKMRWHLMRLSCCQALITAHHRIVCATAGVTWHDQGR